MLRLAVRMLLGDTTKWLGVVLGVFFCTFLITHLLAMFAGMMERSFALITDIPQADIWVMDPAVEYVDEPAGLPPTALQRVQSIRGVEWGVPLYTGSLRARLPGGRFRGVLVIGIDDATLMGAPATLTPGSLAAEAYGSTEISERHRHRYEFNNDFREALVSKGLILSGTSPDRRLVEVIELAGHPYFLGCQFHPELKSRPMTPHPLFVRFVRAALDRALGRSSARTRDERAVSNPTSALGLHPGDGTIH